MEEQLINFETAKLAKEKGFSNRVLYYYNSDGERCINLDGFGPITTDNNSTSYDTSAPTQSLLQKWLREEHHVEIEISQHAISTVNKRYRIFISDYGFLYAEKLNVYLELPTYEEALEKALEKALIVL